MVIEVLAVGRLKDRHLAPLCQDYLDRLGPHLPTKVTEVKTMATLRRRAWADLRRHVVLLDERGQAVSSAEFADFLRYARETRGNRRITLCIGDAHGFTDEDRSRADRVLRLSDLTLPHRLARLLLLEQLYRAATIMAGHPYHHD